MIVHTTVDAKYCKTFLPSFVDNTRQFMPGTLISLALVDRQFDLQGVSVDMVHHDPQSIDDIKANFALADHEQALAYYGLSRFCWLPITKHNVMIRDVDTLAVRNIDIAMLDEMLLQHDVVNLVRRKYNGSTGGLAAIVLSSRICSQVKKFANELCRSKTLYWPIDEEIKFYCQENFDYTEIECYDNLGSQHSDCNFDHAWILHAETFPSQSDLAITLKQRSFERIKRFYQPGSH